MTKISNKLSVLEKTARRRAQMLKKPNHTEAKRREPTSINHHPRALIAAPLSLSVSLRQFNKQVVGVVE